MKNLFLTIAMVMFVGSAIAQETPKQTKSTQDTVQEHLAKKKAAAAKKANEKEQKLAAADKAAHTMTLDTVGYYKTKKKTKK